MQSQFRRRQLARAAEITGDPSLDAFATFRRHPVFAYGLNIAMTVMAIANLATDQLWVRIALLVVIAVNLVGPRGLITVASGSGRAIVSTDPSWRSPIGSTFETLAVSDVRRLGRIRWQVGEHAVWAWGDGGALLERLTERPA